MKLGVKGLGGGLMNMYNEKSLFIFTLHFFLGGGSAGHVSVMRESRYEVSTGTDSATVNGKASGHGTAPRRRIVTALLLDVGPVDQSV